MNNDLYPFPCIMKNDTLYFANMAKLCFVNQGTKGPCTIPFYDFQEKEWAALFWQNAMLEYGKIVEMMFKRILDDHAKQDDFAGMLKCVRAYFLQEERFEALMQLQRLFPLHFDRDNWLEEEKPLASDPESIKYIAVRNCPTERNFLYHVVPKENICREKVYQSRNFIFNRLYFHHAVSLKKTKKSKYEPAPRQVLPADYYEVVTVNSGLTVGHLHVFFAMPDFKAIHTNPAEKFLDLNDVALLFIKGFAYEHYREKGHCFRTVAEATYEYSRLKSLEKTEDPRLHPLAYTLKPIQGSRNMEVIHIDSGRVAGTLILNTATKLVDVIYEGEPAFSVKTPAEALLQMQMRFSEKEIPF